MFDFFVHLFRTKIKKNEDTKLKIRPDLILQLSRNKGPRGIVSFLSIRNVCIEQVMSIDLVHNVIVQRYTKK